MQNTTLRVPPIWEILDVAGSEPKAALVRLRQFYEKGPSNISLDHTRKVTRFLFSGELSLDAAVRTCDGLRPEASRQPNRDAIRLIHPLTEGKAYKCFAMPTKPVAFRSDLGIKLPVHFVYVDAGAPRAVLVQPRKTLRLSERQLGMLASIYRHEYLVRDEAPATFELIDVSSDPTTGLRLAKSHAEGTLPMFDRTSVEEFLQRFTDAYDALRASGFEPKKRDRKARDTSQSQESLFPR